MKDLIWLSMILFQASAFAAGAKQIKVPASCLEQLKVMELNVSLACESAEQPKKVFLVFGSAAGVNPGGSEGYLLSVNGRSCEPMSQFHSWEYPSRGKTTSVSVRGESNGSLTIDSNGAAVLKVANGQEAFRCVSNSILY
jgi:hypothetical protein